MIDGTKVAAVRERRTAPGRRERRRAETAKRILDTAMRLFMEQGYASTTVEAITEAADIGKGTFFNYFPSKEHLVIAFCELQVARLATAAGSAKDADSMRVLIEGVARTVAASWQGNRRFLRSMFGAVLSNDMLSARFEELLAVARHNATLLLKEGQRRGEIRGDIPAARLAHMLQQNMIGAQLVWPMRSGRDLGAWMQQSLDLLWQGIGTPSVSMGTTGAGRRRK
jgi:AcrR family transcriptional regulator